MEAVCPSGRDCEYSGGECVVTPISTACRCVDCNVVYYSVVSLYTYNAHHGLLHSATCLNIDKGPKNLM